MSSTIINQITRHIKIILLLAVVLLLQFNIFGQNCRNYHKGRYCICKHGPGFRYFGQSRSGLFEINKPFSYEVMLYGGKDYIFSVCTEFGYEPVHFKIEDIETGEIIYDNMDDDYYSSVGFSIYDPQKVKVEVTIKAEGFTPEDFSDNRACVGVHILWRKTEKLGF